MTERCGGTCTLSAVWSRAPCAAGGGAPDEFTQDGVRRVHVAAHFVGDLAIHYLEGIPRRAAHLARRLLRQELRAARIKVDTQHKSGEPRYEGLASLRLMPCRMPHSSAGVR